MSLGVIGPTALVISPYVYYTFIQSINLLAEIDRDDKVRRHTVISVYYNPFIQSFILLAD